MDNRTMFSSGVKAGDFHIFPVFPALVFLALITGTVYGLDNQISFDVSSSLDWGRGEIRAEAGFRLGDAGIKLPTGRFMAAEILEEAYSRLLTPGLFSLRVDSNSTIKDLVDRGEISLAELDTLFAETEKTPPSLSPDLARISQRYMIFLEKVSAFLMRHRRAAEAERPLVPVPAADYTGIIIIAEEELPVHGRNSRALVLPCLFPKIWDTDMNLVYERNMLEPPGTGKGALMARYVLAESIFRPTPSGLDEELAALVGPSPLRIFARGVFGMSPTDPVIDREDALRILSGENNRRLLREGRVAFVVNEKVLID